MTKLNSKEKKGNRPFPTQPWKEPATSYGPRASGDERKADRLKESVKKATLFEFLQGASSGLLASESRDVAKRT